MADQEQTEVQRLHEQARQDYQQHNSPETQAAAREQAAMAQINGNTAAGSAR